MTEVHPPGEKDPVTLAVLPEPGRAKPSSLLPLVTICSLLVLSVVEVNLALPPYAVVPTVPFTAPFQRIVSEAEAIPLDSVEQTSGLFVNDPASLPLVMVTAGLLVVQPDSVPLITDELVPPPAFLIAGANLTVADRLQLTDPGASPEYFGGLIVLADAEPAVLDITPNSTARPTAADTYRFFVKGWAPASSTLEPG
jgi:hypothetical protein